MKTISRKEAKAINATVYFTGKPCKHGHVVNRQTCNGWCLECRDKKRRSKTGKALRNKHVAQWRLKNRLKMRAQWNVKDALARGDISQQPCNRCGKPNTHAHHDDYNKPLDIMWLCPFHHSERHRELKAQGEPQ